MNRSPSPRAHRVVVPDSARSGDAVGAPDYASAFAITLAGTDGRTAEEWARTTFEGAPIPLRWFVLFGWTRVLRLRLGPRPSPDYILGWKIVCTAPGTVALEVRSTLIAARKVVEVGPAHLTMTTVVRFERRLGRFIWTALAPVHHLTEPLLLTTAAHRMAAQRASRRNVGS